MSDDGLTWQLVSLFGPHVALAVIWAANLALLILYGLFLATLARSASK
jgi:hypothetical protein